MAGVMWLRARTAAPYVLALTGAILALTWLLKGPATDRLDLGRGAAYDPALLTALAPFETFESERRFSHDLAVVFYLDERSCETCTIRELDALAGWHGRYGDRIEFLLVVHGRDPMYLRNLRRAGKARYPILLEPARGAAGLDRTGVFVIDLSRGRIVADYYPRPDAANRREKLSQLERLLQARTEPGRSN